MTTVIVNPSTARVQKWMARSHQSSILLQHEDVIARSNPLFEAPKISDYKSCVVLSFGEANNNFAGSNKDKNLTHSEICQSARSSQGSFLQIIVYNEGCKIVTDRFGSVPMFYAISDDSELILSSCYNDMVRELLDAEKGGIREELIFCFLFLRRLVGDHAYHSNISVLASGSTTKFDLRTGTRSVERYWAPSMPLITNHRVATELLSDALRGAVERQMKMNVDKRSGLMLSGGLDSRALLAIGGNRYTCFSNTPAQNNEFDIAKQLADGLKAPFVYLQRPADYFSRIFDDAIECSNAMTVFYEAQFIEYLEEISSHADSIHLGLGLDIFFCGHYMNKYHPKIWGRPALYFQKSALDGGSFERRYLEEVSYRMKTSKLKDIVQESQWNCLYDSLVQLVGAKADSGRGDGLEGHALWEYMHLTDFGRHYSMLMANSMRGKIDVCVPALDADLYDLAFAISPELKVNWSVYLAAIRRLDPRLFQIRNSNTNIRASWGLYRQTGVQLTRGILRRIGFSSLSGLPSVKDRSWPLVSEDMSSITMKQKVDRMISYGKIRDLSFIDQEKLDRAYQDHSHGRANHAVLFGLMLTLEHGLLNVARSS